MGRNVAIYCRISQDRAGAGLGVARQEEDCRRLAEARGWTVFEVYVDNDTSAYRAKPRANYERLLDALRTGRVSGVIAWHPDRLHRSPKELETFIDVIEAAGAVVATVQAGDLDLSTAAGRMSARIVGAVARHESEQKSERIRRKQRELAEHGRLSGGGRRPFGYEADRITVRESEAEEIRGAARRVLAGESLRGITHDWRDRGVNTVTDAVWSPTTIKRLLCSGRISGQREHREPGKPGKPGRMRIVGPAVWPAIITPEETARLRAVLNGRNGTGPGNARLYLLSGFVVCGACGTRMTARAAIRKGNRYRRYHCAKDRGGCDRVGVSAERLEELIVSMALKVLDSPALDRIVADDRGSDEARAIEKVQALEADLEQLARDFGNGAMSRTEWLNIRAGIEPRLAEAREVVARHRPTNVLEEIPTGDGALTKAWPGLSLARRRAILGVVLESVIVGSTTRGNNRFDATRVTKAGGGDVIWRI